MSRVSSQLVPPDPLVVSLMSLPPQADTTSAIDPARHASLSPRQLGVLIPLPLFCDPEVSIPCGIHRRVLGGADAQSGATGDAVEHDPHEDDRNCGGDPTALETLVAEPLHDVESQ